MLRIKAKFLIGVLLTLPLISISQDWKALLQAKGPSTVLSRGVEMGQKDHIYWVGVFEEYVVFGADTLFSAGSADGFICKYNYNGIKKWSLRFGGPALDRVMNTTTDKAGNLYLTGGFSDEIILGNDTLTSQNRDVFVAKFDTTGQVVWARGLSGNQSDFGQGIAVDQTGNVYLTGLFMSDSISINTITLRKQGRSDMFLLKLDPNGNPIWAQQGGFASTTVGNAVALDSLNNIYLTGSFQDSAQFSGQWVYSQGRSDAYVACYQPSGSLKWIQSMHGSGFDIGQALAGTDDGVLVTGRFSAPLSLDTFLLPHTGSYDIFVASYDANGQVNWAKPFGSTAKDAGYAIDYQQGHGVFLAGEFSSTINFDQKSLNSQGSTDAFLAKCDEHGNTRWVLSAGGMNREQAYTTFASQDQYIFFAGHFRDYATFDSTTLASGGRDDAFLAKIYDQDTIAPPPIIILPLKGRIFEDSQPNCLADSQEMGYRDWFVVAEPGSFYGMSDAKGDFRIDVPPGAYRVRNIMPQVHQKWLYSSCPPIQYFSTGMGGPIQNTSLLTFGQVEKNSAKLQLSIDSDDFIRCQSGHMVVHYANTGAGVARDVSIQLTIPEEISIFSSSIIPRSQKAGTIQFQLQDLSPQKQGKIDLQFSTSCNAQDREGKNLRIQGNISSPSEVKAKDFRWSGAELQISGSCFEEEKALFIIKNTGTANLNDSALVHFYVDDQLCTIQKVWLEQGDSIGFLVPTLGHTIRCKVEQAAFHPNTAWEQATVEACADPGRFPISTGYAPHFEFYDPRRQDYYELNRPLLSTASQVDWQISPIGRGSQHVIAAHERLYFHIPFETDGRNAIVNLEVVDTLSTWLEPASMRWEARSHLFDVWVDGQGVPVLHFSLSNDSISAGEKGFIAFSMQLKAGTPTGTKTRQQAWLNVNHAKWNPTSWIFHTVGNEHLASNCQLTIQQFDFASSLSTSLEEMTEVPIHIYPNPFANNIQIESEHSLSIDLVSICDLSGKQVIKLLPQERTITVQTKSLSPGIYFIHLHTPKGEVIRKIIKR